MDELEGARVLVVDHAPGRAPERLAQMGAEVTVVDDSPSRAAFRRAVLVAAGREDAVRIGPVECGAPGHSGWDLIVVDGLSLGRARLRTLAPELRSGGRVVVVGDNALSALRAADRVRGRPGGPATSTGTRRRGALSAVGLVVRQSFALLRASAAPVTAFDLDAPEASRAVLQAVATRVSGRRRQALGALERGITHTWTGPVVSALVPARLVLATSASAPWTAEPRRITGRIGYDDSVESKVLRGEPPAEVEKRYASESEASAEAWALETLADSCLDIAPRLLARPAPDRLRVSWLAGSRPLEVATLTDHELEVWLRRAGALLASVQRATGVDGDGRVLVHGDYWLGNLMHCDDRIVGVVDWTTARRGDPQSDLAHLVDSLPSVRSTSPRVLDDLRSAVREAYHLGLGGHPLEFNGVPATPFTGDRRGR
ncbi:MAG: aminoglycoside phosphotransferase family protein [Actinobacteria bacterium]|nr:aminoglycoside phosphotransferase family protein [Actinomycetota bacterium]